MLASSRLPEAERARRIEHAIEMADIESLLDSHPFDLSVASSSVPHSRSPARSSRKFSCSTSRPRVSTPFSSASSPRWLDKLEQEGVAIIMVSHDIEFCARYADAVAMMVRRRDHRRKHAAHVLLVEQLLHTATNRMSRHVFPRAITDEDVIGQCMVR